MKTNENIDQVIKTIEQLSIIYHFLNWFKGNKIMINPDKCNFLLSANEDQSVNIGNQVIKNSQNEKLRGAFMTTLTGSDVQKLPENCRPWRVQQLQGLIEKENSNEQFFNFST